MQEFVFKRIDDGTYSAVQYTGDEAEVVIPSVHAGQPVTVLYDRLFRGHTEIRTIAIPGTITDIGAFVFDGCDNLREIVLPQSLKYLWQYAFVRSSIEEIILPEQIRTLAPYTFKDCKRLKRVVCNKKLQAIKGRAFEGCDRLEDLVHEPGLLISPSAFGEKQNLKVQPNRTGR